MKLVEFRYVLVFFTGNHDIHLISIIGRTITPHFLVLFCLDSIVYQFNCCVLGIIKVHYYILEQRQCWLV